MKSYPYLPLFALLALAVSCVSSAPVTDHSTLVASAKAADNCDVEYLTSKFHECPFDECLALALAGEELARGGLGPAISVLERSLRERENVNVRAQLAALVDAAETKELHARRVLEVDEFHIGGRRELAASLVSQGRCQEASRILAETLYCNVGDTDLLWEMAQVCISLGQYTEAVRYLEYGLAVSLTSATFGQPRIWRQLADLYARDWPKESAEYATHAQGLEAQHFELPLDPDSRLPLPLQRRLNVGFLTSACTDTELEAMGNLVFFVRFDSMAARAGIVARDALLAVARVPLKHIGEARELTEFSRLDSDNFEFEVMRGNQRLALKAERSTEWQCLLNSHSRIQLAQSAYHAAQYKEAAELSRDAGAELGVFNPAVNTLLILSQVALGERVTAVQNLERFAGIASRDPIFLTLRLRAHLAVAQASGRQGDIARAIEVAEEAARAMPSSAFIHACVGQVYLAAGNRESRAAARACFDRALAIGRGGWALEGLAKGLDSYDTNRRLARKASIDKFLSGLGNGLAIGLGGTVAAGVTSGRQPNWWHTPEGMQYTRNMYQVPFVPGQ